MSASPDFLPNSKNGQHLLIDGSVLDTTIEHVPFGERCVEIGAGPGALTERLLGNGNPVVAYEVDTRCEPMLAKLSKVGKLAVHWKSILDEPSEAINAQAPFHLVGNIPFHISEPLLTKMTGLFFSSSVILVGEKMSSAVTAVHPDDASWTRMSLTSHAFFDTTLLRTVPRDSFFPVPRTDGALIRQTRKDSQKGWRADAVTRSYRALVEANAKNSTVGKALKTVSVDATGNAISTPSGKSGSRRSQRRKQNMQLRGYANDYNSRGAVAMKGGDTVMPDSMLKLVADKLGDNTTSLSMPLSAISNSELRRICSTISSIVNHRQASR